MTDSVATAARAEEERRRLYKLRGVIRRRGRKPVQTSRRRHKMYLLEAKGTIATTKVQLVNSSLASPALEFQLVG